MLRIDRADCFAWRGLSASSQIWAIRSLIVILVPTFFLANAARTLVSRGEYRNSLSSFFAATDLGILHLLDVCHGVLQAGDRAAQVVLGQLDGLAHLRLLETLAHVVELGLLLRLDGLDLRLDLL